MESNYYTPAKPSSFGGVKRLASATKKGNVRKWLSYQDAYTLHKPIRRNFNRRRTLVGGIDHQWAIDLADVSSLSTINDGYRFLLTCIDVLSKYAWVVAIYNKSAESVVSAMKSICDKSGRKPLKIQADKGKEFINQKFQKFLSERGIAFFSTENDDIKASIAERFNRTIKERLWRFFTYSRKKRYIDNLDEIVDSYNASYHRTIAMKPKDVMLEDEPYLLDRMYSDLPLSPPPKLTINDTVRIAITRLPFKKGYTGLWSEEIFVVKSIVNSKPITYRLDDLQGEHISGTFYEQELQKIGYQEDRLYVVEKILKQRRRKNKTEYFVNFKGYPEKFNEWITEDNVQV